ncbi:MAG: hypothetical protein AB8B80_01540 [Marinicellaceae bacterium]
MKTKKTNPEQELSNYFNCARNQKCPDSMQQNLYHKLEINNYFSWRLPRLAIAGLTMAFVATLTLNLSNQNNHQEKLNQAQQDLQVAMHYINRVSFKSLSAVNNKGLKPGLIVPLSRSAASL